jgi:hypothetical protein
MWAISNPGQILSAKNKKEEINKMGPVKNGVCNSALKPKSSKKGLYAIIFPNVQQQPLRQ